jgi:hypothetical protein
MSLRSGAPRIPRACCALRADVLHRAAGLPDPGPLFAALSINDAAEQRRAARAASRRPVGGLQAGEECPRALIPLEGQTSIDGLPDYTELRELVKKPRQFRSRIHRFLSAAVKEGYSVESRAVVRRLRRDARGGEDGSQFLTAITAGHIPHPRCTLTVADPP